MLETRQNIASLLRSGATEHGDRTAIETEAGKSITYVQLFDQVMIIAASLKLAEVVSKRERPRIGIVLANGTGFAIALLGVTVIAEAVPFNPNSTEAEFDVYFQRSGIDALLVAEKESGPAVSIAGNRKLPIFRLSPDHTIVGFKPLEFDIPDADADAIALVLMTSGSTGASKLVPLSHRNVCTSAADVCRSMELGPSDRCLSMWEQYHIGGLVDLLLAPLSSGGCVIETSGFNAAAFVALLQDRKPTWYQAVPTTLNELLLHAERECLDCRPNSLRLIRSVAAALAPSLMQSAEDLFGVPVIQTFGMTEAGPLITSTTLPPKTRKPGSVGRSCGAEIRIVDENDNSLPVSVPGEVSIRGANVFSGYEDDEEANRKAFRNGWFQTGDTGYLDADGDLFLTGRIKLLINRGGEKISPQEVDDVLLAHDAMIEAASFALKHKTLGEDIAAAVVVREGVTIEELRSYLAVSLSAFKIPGRIFIMDRLPRNPVGKIDRLALSDMVESVQSHTSHVAPRNELERFLANLWALELNASTVGVHDDFSALGGDSLSSMRILIALEEALDGPIPDEIFLSFSTISGLAEALTVDGLNLKDNSVSEASSKTAHEANTKPDLLSTIAGPVSPEDSLEGATDRLNMVMSRGELNALHDSLALFSTPAELDVILGHFDRLVPGSQRRGELGLLDALALRRVQARWRRQIRSDIGNPASLPSWRRQNHTRSVIHYAGSGVDAAQKTLVCGFAGNQMRLMMPTYRILTSLDPAAVDLLLLVDFNRGLFLGGVDGVGTNLEDVCVFIDDFAKRAGYKRIVSLGTSGGSLAAIYAAVRFGWSKAVAVGPAALSRHGDFADEIERLSRQRLQCEAEVLVETSEVARDVDASNQLKHLFPSMLIHVDKRFTDHNLLHELYKCGELPKFFDRLLA